MKKVLFLMLLFLSGVAVSVKSQVTIGKEKPAEKFSALEIVSNGENGLRLPRMTTAERDKLALSGQTLAEGLVIFNTDTKCMDFWNGTKWTTMCTDVSGRYRLSGKTCFDVSQTEGTTTNGCKPLSSRPNDFALTKSFTYTFSSPTGSSYSELSFITDDPTIATVTYTGETATVTFANDIVSRATGRDKTQALKLSITAQFRDNNAVAKQVSLIVSIQDCGCNCSVKSGASTWLTFMCHNLGADETMSIDEQKNYTSTGDTDATVYGDSYQWGRQTDGHEKRTSPNYPTNDVSTENGALATVDLDGNGQVPSGHNAYGKFIKNNTDPYDWHNSASQSTTLWGASKTANDPCPAGWRVPTQDEWGSIFIEKTNTLSTSGNTLGTYPNWNSTAIKSDNKVRWNQSSNTHGLEISTDNGATTALFLPAAGYRNCDDGSFNYVGSIGYYWSSTPTDTDSYYLFFNSTYVYPGNDDNHGYGFSVRCVAE